MTKELDFCLKLAHYDDDQGGGQGPWRVKPRGRELLERVRHNAAQVSRSAIYLDVRPVDRDLDPEIAEAAKSLLEWEIHHPLKRYAQIRDKVALGALATRMWWAAVEFDPNLGPFGEICFRIGDGRLLMWTPGFDSPHDMRCPCVAEIVPRMSLAEIRGMQGWKNQDKVKPDDGWRLLKDRMGAEGMPTGAVKLDDQGQPTVAGDPYYESAVVVKLWERQRYETNERETDFRVLPKNERYMACAGGCGYRSDKGGQYPEQVEQGCPDCGGNLTRVDAESQDQRVMAYNKGRSLTIFAPFSKVELYHGDWPHRSMRSVPYLVVQFHEHPSPEEPVGQSMTSEHKSMQLASDMTLRIGLEHLMLAKPYIQHPPGISAEDFQGEPFEFRPDQGLAIYLKGDYAGRLDMLQPDGLPPSWGLIHQSLQNVFRSSTGSTDLSLSPSQSKDIPVGTVQALIESGEVPVDHMIEKFRREESIFFGVLFDVARDTYTDERMVRMQGEDGRWRIQALRAADLPDMDIVVTADPSLSRMDKDQLNNLLQFATAPPQVRKFVGRAMNIPISQIRELEEAEAEQLQQMPPAVPGQEAPGVATPGMAVPSDFQQAAGF